MISNGAGHRDREAAPPPCSILRPSSGGVKENLSLRRGLGRFHAPQYPGQKPEIGAGPVIFDRSSDGYEEPPRVGNGAMYVSTADPNHVFAFDPGNPGTIPPATQAETGSHGPFGRMRLVHRAPAGWPGDRKRDPSYFRTSCRPAWHRRWSTNRSVRCKEGRRSGGRFCNPPHQSFALTEASSSPSNRVKAAT